MSESFQLTDEHRQIIREAWRSYDCTMGDPWRNYFAKDGQAEDEKRREYILEQIREQIPEIPEDEIEREIDRIR